MEAASESIESSPTLPGADGLGIPGASRHRDAPARRAARRRVPARPAWLSLDQVRFAAAVFLGTRLLLLLVALADRETRHQRLITELANWDGMWFRALARHGYPTYVSHGQTVLGFFPLFPLVMRGAAEAFGSAGIASVTFAGVILSGIGGLITTLLVQRLTTGWWGEASGRRATVLFCLFPGSVVFSMVYSEGLMLPLAAGCILALERRRWVLAGVLAGLATAVQPSALALVVVCAASSALYLRRHGWRAGRRSVFAPSLSVIGIGAVAAFLWAWTGTPLANYYAQHYGWGEKTDPLALLNQLKVLISQISFSHFNHPTINLNLVVGTLGAIVLFVGVALLLRRPRQVSAEGMVWTFAIGFLAVTSEYVPPNPRLLITAFPAVLVLAHRCRGRAWTYLVAANVTLLIAMSYATFVSTALRP